MLLDNKLYIPHLHPTVVKRSGLMEQLNRGLSCKLTLVAAQAGYGKTTALSEWAQQCEAKVIWISLDRNDNDFIAFWCYVIAGMDKLRPGIAKLLDPPLATFASNAIEPFMIAILQQLHHVTDVWAIVWDDYHTIEDTAIHRSLAMLIDHLPSGIHVYLSSRSEVPFPTSRLLARNEMLRIDSSHLRFQMTESMEFFQRHMKAALTREQVARLVDHAEGWISGLRLAALSLEKSGNQSQSVRAFNGKHRDIAGYLMEEVFQLQSLEMRDFLLKTSLLSEMNRALCEAVTAMQDSQHRLEQLELLNLLIVPLDDHRGWYRYHHLFADFLQHHFKQVQPKQWEDTHARAAAWLEANGFREQAVDHLLAGGHHEEAVRLMERLLPETSHANWHIMHRWLSLLPETAIAGKPVIDIYYIVALIDVGQWEIALKRVKQAESHLLDIKEALTEAEWGQMQGAIYLLQGVAYFGHKDFDRCHEYLERYDKLMPEGNPIHKLSANSSVSSDHEDLLAHINDLSVAESFMKKRIQAWGGKKDFPIVGYFLVSYSELHYEWDRLEEAGRYAEMVLKREDVQSLARILVYAAAVASRILQAQGMADQAVKLLQQVKLRIHSPEQALFMMKIEAQQIRLALRQNDSYFAADWLETCGLHASGPINWYNSSEYLVLARLLANDGRHDQALALLERMYEALSKEDRLRDKIKVLIARSIITYRQRTIQEALIPLAEALHQAEPQGYMRSFLDEGTAMAEMLSAYLQLRQESSSRTSSMASFAYVAKLFQALNRHSRTILTEQERRILALIDKGFTNKEIALKMHVSAETIKWHIKNVYLKLDAKNRVQALRRAKEQALHLHG